MNIILLALGERASENDPTEGSSQSPGVQTEVFNMSQHFPVAQKKSLLSRRMVFTVPFLIQIQIYCISDKYDLTCFPLFCCSDIMMRDNLFEVVTTSRTFYIQVGCFLWYEQSYNVHEHCVCSLTCLHVYQPSVSSHSPLFGAVQTWH